MTENLGIKGGSIENFKDKIQNLSNKFVGTYAGNTLSANLPNLFDSPDERNALLAFRSALVAAAQSLRDKEDLKSINNMLKEIDKIMGGKDAKISSKAAEAQ